jgi:hypothetical protein
VNVAVCTAAHGRHLELLDVTAPALARYAVRHGYEMVEVRHRLDPARPASWDKIVLLRELVDRFDVVMWVDADAIVLDRAPAIEHELSPRHFLYMVEHHLGIERVPNAGVVALRGGPRSAAFLDRVWAQRDLANDPWWDNAAILRVLGYRRVSGIRPVVPTRWRLGFAPLDRAWNSIPAAPVAEPYVVHLPGMPVGERLAHLAAYS